MNVNELITASQEEGRPMSEPRISVQLYSIHQELSKDLDRSLERLAGIGLRNVEAFDFTEDPDTLRAALDRHGLAAPTGHAILIADDVVTPDAILSVPTPEQAFDAAASLGMRYVIDPFVPAERWVDRDDVLRSADVLNRRAELASAFGLQVGYHNHDHELTSIIGERTALELFAENLDERVVLEVDLFWATASGQPVERLLETLGDRVIALHVKDGPMTPRPTAANLPRNQVPAGQGEVNLLDGIRTARAAEYAVIEFDYYDGDTFQAIAESFTHLTKNGISA